jgi:hypothetical protein
VSRLTPAYSAASATFNQVFIANSSPDDSRSANDHRLASCRLAANALSNGRECAAQRYWFNASIVENVVLNRIGPEAWARTEGAFRSTVTRGAGLGICGGPKNESRIAPQSEAVNANGARVSRAEAELRYTRTGSTGSTPAFIMASAPSSNSSLRMTDGFEIVPSVLDQSEAADAATALQDSALKRSRAGARHLISVPVVQQLARESRLVTIAARFVGPEAVPFRATLFDKSSANNWLVVWHQDTALPLRERRDIPGWGPWSIKAGITYAHAPATALSRVVALRLHIDDSDADNGPLRVLPGTHRMGVLSDAEIGQLAREIPPVDCIVPAGGIVAMRPLLVHASSKAESTRRRRVLHIEYSDSLHMTDDLELAMA